MLEKLHHVMVVALALTFAAGVLSHGVRASEAGVKTVAAVATDLPMSGKCDGCGDGQKAMARAGACAASCSSFVALPAMGVAFDPAPAMTRRPRAEPSVTGHTVTPDPYPPRAIVLS